MHIQVINQNIIISNIYGIYNHYIIMIIYAINMANHYAMPYGQPRRKVGHEELYIDVSLSFLYSQSCAKTGIKLFR